MCHCAYQLLEVKRMRGLIPAWCRSPTPGGLAFLGLGVGLCVLAWWMSASPETPPPLPTQVLAASLAPTAGAHMPTETLVITSGVLRGQPPSRDLLQEILLGSRLSPLWLNAHGFLEGSEALERLHGLMNGHTRLSAPNVTKVAFGPQGTSSAFAASEMPVLATQERYVQAAVSLPDGWQGDSVLLRWRNASDNAVIELSAQSIPPNVNQPIPVWMYEVNDWPPGRYRVEVISPDASLQVLAAGDFEIAGPNARLTPFSFEATNTAP